MSIDNASSLESGPVEPNWNQLGLSFFREQEAKLQKEKPGNKNMFEIAEQLFLNLRTEGCITDQEKEAFLSKFHEMLLGIEVNKYENFESQFNKFWEKHGSNIARLALWSQGDVNGTGYQTVKLYKSGLFRDLGEIVGDKMDYLVSEDKFDALDEYLDQLRINKSVHCKIVAIDDLPKNLEKVGAQITHLLPGVEVIKVYAGYNRRVERLKQTSPDTYQALMSNPTTIRSFGELSEKPIFDKIFANAYVLLDVDGVILDNKKTGEKVGSIFYELAKEQVEKSGINNPVEVNKVLSNILNIN